MTVDLPTILAVIFQVAVLAMLLVLSVRLIRKSGRSLTAVFLTFLFSLWLFTDLYWLIYDLMRPDRRMPFAVNEIGEAAIFLLMPAILGTAVRYRMLSARKQVTGAALFIACNAALWIAWSGEWAQDILIGAVFAYFCCSTVCSLKAQRLMTKREWIGLGIGCALLIFGQTGTFLAQTPLKNALDTGCYLLLAAGTAWWAYRLFVARKQRYASKSVLCLVMALTCWTMMAKYLSAGIWYLVFLIVETLSLVLMYLSARKVVAEA